MLFFVAENYDNTIKKGLLNIKHLLKLYGKTGMETPL